MLEQTFVMAFRNMFIYTTTSIQLQAIDVSAVIWRSQAEIH